ncbi:MAG TPA: hypothetical protein VG992_03850 [Candidatus Saccharimonadales bacterium]|nr:hypothetical protein [Candidatus Saccharimonadales bacterium]
MKLVVAALIVLLLFSMISQFRLLMLAHDVAGFIVGIPVGMYLARRNRG